MYFVLLRGTHLGLGNKKYQVEMETNTNTGVRRIKSQPVVESERDLVAAFGPEKFREISKSEADFMLKTAGKQEKPNPVPAVSAKSNFVKAAEEGAVGIAEPPGVDVTHKFEKFARKWPKIAVFFKRGKGFYIVDARIQTPVCSGIVTEEPLRRDEVAKWVKAYMKG